MILCRAHLPQLAEPSEGSTQVADARGHAGMWARPPHLRNGRDHILVKGAQFMNACSGGSWKEADPGAEQLDAHRVASSAGDNPG